MTEPSHRYRDPLEVLIAEEERTCRGCIHLSSLWGMPICKLKNKHANHRCKHYDNPTERGNDGIC